MGTAFIASLALLLSISTAGVQPPPEMPSYPIKTSPEEVYELPRMEIEHSGLQVRSEPVLVVPISCERGVTGAILLGEGTYRFARQGVKPVEGHFRAAMLRFNPEDAARLVPTDQGKKLTDRGAYEMARHLLRGVFPRCWYSGKEGGRIQEALIPPKGIIACLFLSKEHGELLVSFGEGDEVIVHSNMQREPLYWRKREAPGL